MSNFRWTPFIRAFLDRPMRAYANLVFVSVRSIAEDLPRCGADRPEPDQATGTGYTKRLEIA